jgi:hypothetical protein
MDGEPKNYTAQIALAWLLVGIPLLWGVYKTLISAWQLFQ